MERATFLILLLAASLALAGGAGSEPPPVTGWRRGLQAVVLVVMIVGVAVFARRLGSRASTWSANRRRAQQPQPSEEDPADRL